MAGPDFLKWEPGVSADELNAHFRELVVGAGEEGCGFEAPLEAWYRFLVDPEPATGITRVPCPGEVGGTNCIEPQGVDETILSQRAAFLRPDSLLAIVQLTDEDDCSLNQSGMGHWAVSENILGAEGIPVASSECATNPNSECCHSCVYERPSQCQGDGGCAGVPRAPTPTRHHCWDHKRRFGAEYTYPTTRYSDALTKKTLKNHAGEEFENPLLAHRDRSFVFLSGIVGVPWQDLAVDIASPDLGYMTASELTAVGRWQWMLGVPEGQPEGSAPIPPTDPFMIQSVEIRHGRHPLTGDDPSQPNSINGQDRESGTLQNACMFPRLEERDCSQVPASLYCECTNADAEENPACRGTVQTHATAQPSTRLLQVLKEFSDEQVPEAKDNAIAASICAMQLDDPDSSSYGYTPAILALIERLKSKLKGACLSRELDVAEDGTVPCRVVQAIPRGDAAGCPCEEVPNSERSIYSHQVADLCDGPSCEDGYCYCDLPQLNSPGNECQTVIAEDAVTEIGWCYLDGGETTKDVLNSLGCEGVNPHSLRVVGAKEQGTLSFLSCVY